MPLYQVVVLAILQGLTEFLPVSSSAHLALAPWLLGWTDPGLVFDIALHIGTLVSVLIYFFRDWLQILGNAFKLKLGSNPEYDRNPNLLWYLAVGSIPVGVVGFLFQKQAESTLRHPYIIGTMLIVVGVLMAISDRVTSGGKHIGQITFADALAIGGAQALAIIPGTSRSGITITTGRFLQLGRETAARFSFLLSTPAIAGAGLKGLHDIKKAGGIPPEMQLPFLAGILISGVVGCLVIGAFLRYLQRFSLQAFVIYRIAFGIMVIALAFFLHYRPE